LRRYKVSKPAGFVFPVDALWQYFGMPTPEPEAEPPPPRIKTQYNPKPVILTNRKNPDGLITIVSSYYDGKSPFDVWLNQPTTTCYMLHQLERLLRNPIGKRSEFIRQVGIEETDAKKGELIGKMQTMVPHVRMQEMLAKYKNHEYSGMAEYIRDENWLLSFFGLHDTPADADHPIIDMMEHCRDMEEMSQSILSYYFGITELRRQKNYLWSHLRANAILRFYDELRQRQQTNEFRAGYCAGVLKKLNMMDTMEDPYWLDDVWWEPLKEICAFYARVIHWDRDFVKKHFPVSMLIFLGKRKPDFWRLHTLFIKTSIYKSAQEGMSFEELIADLEAYQKSAEVNIYVKKDRLALLYRKLFDRPQMWAHKKMEGLVRVELNETKG